MPASSVLDTSLLAAYLNSVDARHKVARAVMGRIMRGANGTPADQ